MSAPGNAYLYNLQEMDTTTQLLKAAAIEASNANTALQNLVTSLLQSHYVSPSGVAMDGHFQEYLVAARMVQQELDDISVALGVTTQTVTQTDDDLRALWASKGGGGGTNPKA